jgi:MoxR-like ATPase
MLATRLARLQQIRLDLRSRFRKRDAEIDGILVSLIARKHLVMIGAPGQAKTALPKAVAGYISDSKVFHVGMHKGTTPNDLFGGPDIVALARGEWRRATEGRLADCHMALLDEALKSSEGTLNSTLVPLSDFEFEGSKIPLVSAILCSNELPQELRGQVNGKPIKMRQGEDSLLAFWDRFGFRFVTSAVEEASPDWRSIVFANVTSTISTDARISLDDLRHMQEDAAQVIMPANIEDMICDLAVMLRLGVQSKGNAKVEVSVRTWRAVPAILRAVAYLAGRTEVEPGDVMVLRDVLWVTPDQREVIGAAILDCGSPIVRDCAAIVEQASNLVAALIEQRIKAGSSSHAIAISQTRVSNSEAVGASEQVVHAIRASATEIETMRPASTEDTKAVESSLASLRVSYSAAMRFMAKRLAGSDTKGSMLA